MDIEIGHRNIYRNVAGTKMVIYSLLILRFRILNEGLSGAILIIENITIPSAWDMYKEK